MLSVDYQSCFTAIESGRVDGTNVSCAVASADRLETLQTVEAFLAQLDNNRLLARRRIAGVHQALSRGNRMYFLAARRSSSRSTDAWYSPASHRIRGSGRALFRVCAPQHIWGTRAAHKERMYVRRRWGGGVRCVIFLPSHFHEVFRARVI